MEPHQTSEQPSSPASIPPSRGTPGWLKWLIGGIIVVVLLLVVVPTVVGGALVYGLFATRQGREAGNVMREIAQEVHDNRGDGVGAVNNFMQKKIQENSPQNGSGAVVPQFAKLSDDFPKDIPVYPGSTVIFSVSAMKNGQKDFSSSFTVSPEFGNADKVLTYYKGEMQKDGWKIDSEANAMIGSTVVGSKSDVKLAVAVFGNEQGTSVTAAYTHVQ